MAGNFWQWLNSDAGLAARIAFGVVAFAALAAWDIRRRGRDSQRWREYLFLLSAVGAALAYGVVNDQITVTISWEYFFYGKGLHEVLGAESPPKMAALRIESMWVGLKATWTAGLLIGVAVLVANNPRKNIPQLSYRRIYALIPLVFAAAACGGAVFGLAGWFGVFAGSFEEIVGEDLWRPERFMAVWGAHLGGYVGGLVGTVAAVWWILRSRGRLKAAGERPSDENKQADESNDPPAR